MRGFSLRLWTVAVAVLLPFLFVGCAEVVGNVSGEVKMGDKPLSNGTITFQGTTKKKKAYPAGVKDGKYSVTEIPAGEYTITVQGGNLTPPPTAPTKGAAIKPKNPKSKEKPTMVHSKYMDTKKSGLSYTVVQGDQTHNITVEAEAVK